MSPDFPHLPLPVNTLLPAPTYSTVSESMYKSLQVFLFPHRLFLGEWIRWCFEETRQMWGIIKMTQSQGVEESSADQSEPWACRGRCFVRNGNTKKWEMSLSQTLSRYLPGVSSFPVPPPLYNPAHKSLSRMWGAKDGDLCFPGLTQRGGDVPGLSAVRFWNRAGSLCSQCELACQSPASGKVVSQPSLSGCRMARCPSERVHLTANAWQASHQPCFYMPPSRGSALQQQKKVAWCSWKNTDKGSEGWVQSPTSQVTLNKLACP